MMTTAASAGEKSKNYSLLLLLAVLVLTWGITSCKRDEPGDKNTAQVSKEKPVSDSPSPQPAGEKEKDAGARRKHQAKPTASSVYFGDLGMELSSELLNVEPQEGRSVILVVIDALAAGHMGIYGYERDTSPNIDGIGRDGVVFTNHVTNSSWTRPSYTTIITGLPKSGHGVELSGKNLEGKIETLAERFKKAGYRTAAFVGNPLVDSIWGHDQGYRVYRDCRHYGSQFPSDERLMDDALDWLEYSKDKPFFVTLFLTAPHVPYDPPEDHRTFLGSEPGEYPRFPFREYKTPLPQQVHQRVVAAYDDEITHADAQVGRLWAFMKENGLDGNTVLAITADHGEAMGDHDCYGHTYHMWESVARVPLIIRWPGMPQSGVIEDRPFTHMDLAPTLLSSAGLSKMADDLPGVSIGEILASREKGRHRLLTTAYDAHGIRRLAVRNEGLKLIHYDEITEKVFKRINGLNKRIERADPRDLPTLVASLEGARYELYDLLVDPAEKNDLYCEKKTEPSAQELKDFLKTIDPGSGEPAKLSPEMVEALKNAGYFVPEGN